MAEVWDHELTEEQREAASHVGTHARVLAGPGTGKTRCLTRRIAYLVKDRGVMPEDVLVVTFTRAAAAEVRGRVDELLDGTGGRVAVSTLHSYALRTILRHTGGVRLPQPVRIADDYEERWIVLEDLKRILNLSKVKEARELLEQLSADWQQLSAEAGDWEERFLNPAFLGAWREHRDVYGYSLRAELVYQLKRALDAREFSLDAPGHVLVDEYQDLNACDLAVVKHLAAIGAELYACGDDDQSIYGFRYANPEGIRRFPSEYDPCEGLVLCECKRCDLSILEYAQYVARQDFRRIDKALRPADTAGRGEVRVLWFASQDPEAMSIARICRHLTTVGQIPPDNIFILLRSDHQRKFSSPIRQALEAEGVAVGAFVDPMEVFNDPDQTEGRQFLAKLRLIADPSDSLAWRTLLELDRNSVGRQSLDGVYDLARRRGQRFARALDAVVGDTSLIPRGGRVASVVKAVRSTLSRWRPDDIASVNDFICRLAEETIRDPLVCAQVTGTLERVCASSSCSSLDQVLRSLAVSLGEMEQERERGKVAIMTMHQAKGLSADVVFVVAAEKEYIPGRAVGEQVDDERRLLYVSLTRARHRLYVTHCEKRTGPQQHSGNTPSRAGRHLTPFLDGGPVGSEDGLAYVSELTRGSLVR